MNLVTLCTACGNSQRDLAEDEWRAARLARGQSVPGKPDAALVARGSIFSPRRIKPKLY